MKKIVFILFWGLASLLVLFFAYNAVNYYRNERFVSAVNQSITSYYKAKEYQKIIAMKNEKQNLLLENYREHFTEDSVLMNISVFWNYCQDTSIYNQRNWNSWNGTYMRKALMEMGFSSFSDYQKYIDDNTVRAYDMYNMTMALEFYKWNKDKLKSSYHNRSPLSKGMVYLLLFLASVFSAFGVYVYRYLVNVK